MISIFFIFLIYYYISFLYYYIYENCSTDKKKIVFKKEANMKKVLIILAVAILLFSGCIDQKTGNQKTVKIGDNVSVDYTGYLNGKVFDTSLESIAKENNLSVPNRSYKPLKLTVGKGRFFKGLEEGIIGMKVGESKTLAISPENAYGQKDPQLIQTIPIIQNVPIIKTFPKIIDVPIGEFELAFGSDIKVGDNFQIPSTNINLTVMNINKTSNVSASYNLPIGYQISQLGTPWNDTVIKIDDNNIIVKSDVKKNEIIQFEDVPWNTTIINVDSENMTMRHNSIPDTKIKSGLEEIKIHFSETDITMDSNNELAGETLTFNVTIKSIESTTPP